jgi:hypothetical protein
MKKFVSLFLIFSLLALSGNLIAKERRGAELVVQKKDGQIVRGELIAVKENSLLMLVSGVDLSVDIKDIKIIRIVKKSGLLLGAGIGLLIGGGIVAIGRNAWEKSSGWDIRGYLMLVTSIPVMTTLIGAMIGGSKGKDEKIRIEGMPQETVNFQIEKLRSEARIPDYQ